MPTVPTPATQGIAPLGSVQVNPLNPVFQNLQRPDMASNARALGSLGSSLGVIAQDVANRDTERRLLEIQKAASAMEDDLYNPQTGVLTKMQGNAVGITKMVSDRVDQFANEYGTGDGLSHSGRIAVEKYMSNLRERLTGRAEAHETAQDGQYRITQLKDVLEQTSDRVVREAIQAKSDGDIKLNEESYQAAIIHLGDTVSMIAEATGLPQGAADSLLEEQVTKMSVNRLLAIGQDNPQLALKMLGEEVNNIDPDAYVAVEASLTKVAKDRDASDQADHAGVLDAGGKSAQEVINNEGSAYTTQFTYNLGPRRPNPPDAAIQHVLGMGAEAVLGKGARVEIFSGQENDLPQYGSPRHKTGAAADVRFYRPNGSLVKLSDPEFMPLAYEMAKQGALGIGAGTNYMGDAMHVDLVRPDAAKGQGNVWADLGGNAGDFQTVMNSADATAARVALGIDAGGVVEGSGASQGGYTTNNIASANVAASDGSTKYLAAGAQYLLTADMPADVRHDAIAYYNQRQAFITKQRTIADAALLDDIFTRIYENDNVKPLSEIVSPAEVHRLGTNISTVRGFYNSTATGGVTTDWTFYTQQREMARDDPAKFVAQFKSDPSFAASARQQLGTTEYKALLGWETAAITAVDNASRPAAPPKTFSLSQIQAYINQNSWEFGIGADINSEADQQIASEIIAHVQNDAEILAAHRGEDLKPTVDLPAIIERYKTPITSDTRGFKDMTLGEALHVADTKFATWEDMVDAGLQFTDPTLDQGLEINANIAERIAIAYGEETGRAPTPSELLGFVARYLMFNSGTRGVFKEDLVIPVAPRMGPPVGEGSAAQIATRAQKAKEAASGAVPISPAPVTTQDLPKVGVTPSVPSPVSDVSYADILNGDNMPKGLDNRPTPAAWAEYMDSVDPDHKISDEQRSALFGEWLNRRK